MTVLSSNAGRAGLARSGWAAVSGMVIAAVIAATTSAGPASATVVAPATVITGPADQAISWHTPIELATRVQIASYQSGRSASTVITLRNASAPTSYAFQLSLPEGLFMVSDGAGGYDVIRAEHRGALPVGHLDAPWARDATGRVLPTSFALVGTTLIQTIDTAGAEFPVIADPHYTWGWITGTIYFNKHETRLFTAYGTAVGFIATLGGPWAPLLRGYVAYLMTVAATASADGKCLKVKSTLIAYEYSGGYCR